MLVTLALRGMQFHAFHGCLEVERELGQIFSINVGLDYELSPKRPMTRRRSPLIRRSLSGFSTW